MLDTLQRRWRMVLGLVLVLSAGIYLVWSNRIQATKAEQIRTVSDEITELQVQLSENEITEEDLNTEVEVIEEAGVTVTEMGQEMAESQNILARAYMTIDPIDDYTDDELDELEEAELTYTRLTGVTNYADLWLFNDEWRLVLDSVGTYADAESIPVAFSIYTADDELAGIVRGTYQTDRDLITDITRDYTQIGINDRADVGGQ